MDSGPKNRIGVSTADKIAEVTGWLALAGMWIIIFSYYSRLPDTLPIHYNAAGQVDGYGDKATFFLLPLIVSVLFLGMILLSRFPQIFNYPVKINADNADRQYTLGVRMIRYLKLAIALIGTLSVFKTIQVATGKTNGMGNWFLPLVTALIFIPLLIFGIQSKRIKK